MPKTYPKIEYVREERSDERELGGALKERREPASLISLFLSRIILDIYDESTLSKRFYVGSLHSAFSNNITISK